MDVDPPGSLISSPSDNDGFTTGVIPASGTAWDPNRGYSISDVDICYHTGEGCLAWTTAFDSFAAGSWSGTVTVPGIGSYTIESRAAGLSGHMEETPDAVNITAVDPG